MDFGDLFGVILGWPQPSGYIIITVYTQVELHIFKEGFRSFSTDLRRPQPLLSVTFPLLYVRVYR